MRKLPKKSKKLSNIQSSHMYEQKTKHTKIETAYLNAVKERISKGDSLSELLGLFLAIHTLPALIYNQTLDIS